MAVHVLAYLERVLRDGVADWRRNAIDVVAGVGSRRALLVGAVLAGVVLALATLPTQRAVEHHGGRGRHSARAASALLAHVPQPVAGIADDGALGLA